MLLVLNIAGVLRFKSSGFLALDKEVGMRSVKTSISISCSHLGALIRIGLPQPYSQGSTGSGEIAGQRRSATLTFRTPAGWHGIL